MAKTSQPTDYDVFISYSHRDRGRVEQLREQLTRSGLSVWWDEHIYSGDRFVAEIFEHIAQCGVVLVCWSRNSRERPWVQMEADHAEKEKKMVGISLDNQLPPKEYQNYQVAKFRSWRGDPRADIFQKLVRVIKWRIDIARIRKGLLAFGILVTLIALLSTFVVQMVSQHVRQDGVGEPKGLTLTQAVTNVVFAASKEHEPPLVVLRQKLVQTFDACPASASYFFAVHLNEDLSAHGNVRLGGALWDLSLYAIGALVFVSSTFLFLRFGMPFGKAPSQYLLLHLLASALLTWIAYAFLSLDPSPRYAQDIRETCTRFWNPAAVFVIWSAMFLASQLALAGLGWVQRTVSR